MFKNLKTSATRAGVLSIVLLFSIGLQAALLGAATNLAYDACTNPMIRFAWTVVIKLAQHKLGSNAPPPGAAANKAKAKMRRPVKSSLRARTALGEAEHSPGPAETAADETSSPEPDVGEI
ncbi:MAG: hypothetical protein CL454_00115 [Acidimicrobiaceae bacterium]|nr:hypothetical protein [Acidimicrobiaceae bacterium]